MSSSTDLNILIYSADHKSQRYNTCGDYFQGENCLHVVVSRLPDRREMLLVAIHELIEWALVSTAADEQGVSQTEAMKVVDDFDLNWQPHHGIKEPGDDFNAVYYTQHQIATGIERILAAEMGVDWLAYERHINDLDQGDNEDENG